MVVPLPSKTVVVLGASYGGARAARLLSLSLPAGWRLIVIDRNSHMNRAFATSFNGERANPLIQMSMSSPVLPSCPTTLQKPMCPTAIYCRPRHRLQPLPLPNRVQAHAHRNYVPKISLHLLCPLPAHRSPLLRLLLRMTRMISGPGSKLRSQP